MAKRAETTRKPQSNWGRTSRVVRGSVLAMSLVAGASSLQAEPLEADTVRANLLPPIAAKQNTRTVITSQSTSGPALSKSVSAFSAAQSDTARVLLAQELGGESNRAVGVPSLPARPEADAGPRQGEAQVRANEAAEANEEETAIVGRSLRAFTRDQDEAESSAPRRRASFSSAISRAAAAGALTSTSPHDSLGTSLSSSRFTPATSGGQFDPGFSEAAEVLSVVPGLRLESASIFGGYSSNSFPRGANSLNNASNLRGVQLGADYDLGASAVISYSRNGRRSLTRFTYSPSHVQRSRIPQWSTTDHRMSLQSSRDLTPRLSLRGSANAGNTGLEQFWMRPAVTRKVEAPASFNELMERVLAGEISNDEFAAILTGSPVVDDPGGAERDLNRIFSVSARTNLSYSYSRRLTFNFGGSTSATRLLNGSLRPGSPSERYVDFANSTNATASADYRLSSRTRIGLSHVTTFARSSYIRSRSQSPTVSLSQTLSRHWSYEVGAGVGMISFDESSPSRALQDATTWTAHGLLGYTTGAHQISLSADKRVGDAFGYGSRSTAQANLSWGWQPRFSPWGANAGIAFSRTDFGEGPQLGQEFSSDLYSAGMSRRLTPSTSFRTDYYYGAYISPYTGVASNMSLHRLQMSLMWRPVERR